MQSELYVREKLWQATQTLATSPEPLQARLRDAAVFLVRLHPNDFAEPERRAAFTGIVDALTSSERSAEGSIAAATSRMSDREASRLAEEIIGLDTHYRPVY